MRSGSGHSKTRTALIFDIGGGSVGVALVRYRANEVPEVLFFKRKEYLFLENLAYDRFVVSMTEALEGLAQDIEASLASHYESVRDVVTVYASPWYVAETRLIHDAKPKPFLVTEGYIDSLSKEAVKQFHSVHDADPRYGDLKLLQDSLIQIRLNGYATLAPVGKSARTVDTAFFISGMSDMLHGRVKKIIDRIFPHAARHAYASNHVLFSTIRNLYAGLDNFFFMHVGGEVSDLSLVSDGVLAETISFPFGEHTLIRETSQSLKSPPAETETLLRTNGRPILPTGSSKSALASPEPRLASRLEGAIAHSEAVWGALFAKAMSDISKEGLWSDTFFMVTESSIGSWFADFLKSVDTPGELKRRDNFSGTFLGAHALAPYVTLPKEQETDFFLILGSLFFGEILSHGG